MHMLRTASQLTRLVLAWFVLTLGVAVASPLIHPHTLELVCADGRSMKLIVLDGDGQVVDGDHHTLDCPMCFGAGAPPSRTAALPLAPPDARAHALQPQVAAHLAGLVGAPLPARGPPAAV